MHLLPDDTLLLIISYISSYVDFASLLSTSRYMRRYNCDKMWITFLKRKRESDQQLRLIKKRQTVSISIHEREHRAKLKRIVLNEKRNRLYYHIYNLLRQEDLTRSFPQIMEALNVHINKYGFERAIFKRYLYPAGYKRNASLIQIIFDRFTLQDAQIFLQTFPITKDPTIVKQLVKSSVTSVPKTEKLLLCAQLVPELDLMHGTTDLVLCYSTFDSYMILLRKGLVPHFQTIPTSFISEGLERFGVDFINLVSKNELRAFYDTVNIFNVCKDKYLPVLNLLLEKKLLERDRVVISLVEVFSVDGSLSKYQDFENLCKRFNVFDEVITRINKRHTAAFILKYVSEFNDIDTIQDKMLSKIDFTTVNIAQLARRSGDCKAVAKAIEYCIERGTTCKSVKNLLCEIVSLMSQKDSIYMLRAILKHPNCGVDHAKVLYTYLLYLHGDEHKLPLILECLMEHGAPITYIDNLGATLFHFVCKRPLSLEFKIKVIGLLAKYGGAEETTRLVNMKDNGDCTALDRTKEPELQEFLKLNCNAH